MGWSGNMCAPAPYVIDANEELIDRIAKDDMVPVSYTHLVYRHLYSFEYVTSCQVDSSSHLERQFDVGFRCRY